MSLSEKKPRFMLASKIILIVTVIVLYAMQVSIAIPMYGILHSKNLGNFNFKLIGILLGVSLVLGLIAFILAIVGAVKDERPLTIISVIVKAAMIPFFGINFYLWLQLIGGMANPFLFLGIPFVGLIGVCLTYVYMLMSGMPDVIYTIIFCIKNKKRPTLLMVGGCILCFIFMVDIVGIIMIHKSYNKILAIDK
ncbi:MAG: hypothetical protein J6U54_03005 [Clostridiales bacterium]|nr:hypothetical protein [Clostridiales bacterium]